MHTPRNSLPDKDINVPRRSQARPLGHARLFPREHFLEEIRHEAGRDRLLRLLLLLLLRVCSAAARFLVAVNDLGRALAGRLVVGRRKRVVEVRGRGRGALLLRGRGAAGFRGAASFGARGLAEEEDLELVVDRQDTSTGNTTEDVGGGTLEERLDALLGDDLATSVEGTGVVDGLTRGHHHATTDGIKGVRSDTGTGGDGPTKSEGGEEVALKATGEDDGLDGVVHAEVETTVDNDTSNGGHETTVETGNTTVELALTTLLGVLGVVGQTGTGVVEGVDEEEGSGTGSLGHGVAVTLLLVAEHGLELVTESEVQGLGREVTDDVGSVATPQGHDTLIRGGTLEALGNAVVLAVKTTLLQHLILVLDEELDTLNGGGSGLGDSGRDTTHEEIRHEGL
ncbi:hypothetical protein BN1708_000269 [Verticillium longisporum]|uniref:Uncharacterized protein n=1 Tax=Verticillium longisporum TaxID=100787 RepID=A0A0G4KDW2_VERLO|nr:hypothetical protein BN1708_000269 [Verticillium longisporum]